MNAPSEARLASNQEFADDLGQGLAHYSPQAKATLLVF